MLVTVTGEVPPERLAAEAEAAPSPQLHRDGLTLLALALNTLFPDREQPFPLPPEYALPKSPEPAPGGAGLFETVSIRGVPR